MPGRIVSNKSDNLLMFLKTLFRFQVVLLFVLLGANKYFGAIFTVYSCLAWSTIFFVVCHKRGV